MGVISSKKEPIILLLGDVVSFVVALCLTLMVRYGEGWTFEFKNHILPFSILFIIWVIVFFISGLYNKHTTVLQSRLLGIILNAQVVNSIVAVTFFYFGTYFGISPKTNLFIYLILSFVFILIWRTEIFSHFSVKTKQNAIIIGTGEEMKELKIEVNENPRYGIHFVSSVDLDSIEKIDFQKEILERIYSENISVVAVDLEHEKVEPILPELYNMVFSGVKFVDMHKVYEDIFDRVPLSLLKYSWFLENISLAPKAVYDFLKRFMDILVSFILGIISLLFYPFVCLAIKIDDGGPIFSSQERVGKNNRPIKVLKFRTMQRNDGGKWGKDNENKVTRVGKFLRNSRIDELPQLWNVLSGSISLIGPRPEFPEPVKHYEEQVPYYNVRHLIKPGLSGWAQIHHEQAPHHALDVGETKVKLSYDLYYIKNRSFTLDLRIALQTIKAVITRMGA